MSSLNPLYDPTTDNAPIDSVIQARLNTPLSSTALSAEEEAFLKLILDLVNSGVIQIHTPSSLLNKVVYEALTPEVQGQADLNAVILLSRVRDIVDLTRFSREPSYQLKQLLASLLETKKRLEEHGDLFVI